MEDFILNNQVTGDVATILLNSNFDTGALRPFLYNGKSYVTLMAGTPKEVTIPVTNASATLRRDDWIAMDKAIVKAAQPRLNAVADLKAAGLVYTIGNGMGKTVLETETQSDITDADISMDGIRKTTSDRPEFDLNNLPLPITHKDFHFTARQIAASRNGGSPLDTTMGELCGRKIAESAEKLLLGVSSSYTYGGGSIYGYTNFPSRLTKSMTLPTDSAWTPATTVEEVLEMRRQAQDAYHYGPYMLYCSPNWDAYLDADYSTQKGDNTLRERLMKIQNIGQVKTLEYLTGYQMILVQMTSDVVREVEGMALRTVQWPSKGGMQINFKVLMIMVPQLRADHYDNTGIVHGTAS